MKQFIDFQSTAAGILDLILVNHNIEALPVNHLMLKSTLFPFIKE